MVEEPDEELPDDEDGFAPPAETTVASGAAEEVRVFSVRKDFNDPKRLDQYLVIRMQEPSRAAVQKLLDGGYVTLNGGKAKASHKIRPGDRIEVRPAPFLDDRPEPEAIPLDILYEDEFVIILNKQANLIVHPGRGKENWRGTLTNALQYHFEQLSTAGGAARPGIVHRLDRDTTGVIVCAKDDAAHRHLALQFEQRKTVKEYLALCYGEPDRDGDYVEKPIGHHPSIREKMAIREPPAGKPATTFYEVAERFRGFCLVRCRLHTGRTHQIRVHLESVGLPIVADKMYAGRDKLQLKDVVGFGDEVLIARQALHAHRLRLRHPRCLEWMDVTAPPPADFERALAALRQHRAA